MSVPPIKVDGGFEILQHKLAEIVEWVSNTICPFELATPAPTPPPTIGFPCDATHMSVLLALDRSASISVPEWAEYMRYVDSLIEALPIGKGRMRVGIVEFAKTARLVQRLSDDAGSVLEGRRAITHERGVDMREVSVDMSEPAKLARQLLTDKRGPRMLLMITDGLPTNREMAAVQFEAAKDDGIEVVMVLVGARARHPSLSRSKLEARSDCRPARERRAHRDGRIRRPRRAGDQHRVRIPGAKPEA